MINIRPLDKGSHIPLYLQLTAQLTELIHSGELKPNYRLPSEREMAEMLNVSRITARLAVQELLESGLVYREQGRGTFVAEPKMRGVQAFTSFTEYMRNHGLTPRSKIISQELVGVDEGRPGIEAEREVALPTLTFEISTDDRGELKFER